MMRRRLSFREGPAAAEVWALLINVVVALVITLIGKTSGAVPTAIQTIAIVIVPAVTLVVLVFKHDVLAKMTSRLELYRAAFAITDSELQAVALDRIKTCANQIGELSNGVLNGSPEELYSVLARKILHARAGIRAAHVSITPQEVKLWNDPAPSHYYEMNKELIQKHRVVERAFVMRKHEFVRDGKFDTECAAVIRRQVSDGVKVHIVWEEDIRDQSLWQDYIIVDDDLVMVNEPTGSTLIAGWRTSIVKGSERVSTFVSKFEKLIASHGRNPATILE
jgi:hypothetical protein